MKFDECVAHNTDLGASHVLTLAFVRSCQMECEVEIRSSIPLRYCIGLYKVHLLVLVDFE